MLLTEPMVDSTRFSFSLHHPAMAWDRMRAEDASWDETRRQVAMNHQNPAEDDGKHGAILPGDLAQVQVDQIALPETSQGMSVLDRATELSHGLDLPEPPTWSVDAAITSHIYQENCPLSSFPNMESGQNLPSTGTNADVVQEVDVNVPVFDGNGDYVKNILPTVQTRASPPHAPAGAMDMQGHAPPPLGHIMNDIMGMPEARRRAISMGVAQMQSFPPRTMANPAVFFPGGLPNAAESNPMPEPQLQAVLGEVQPTMAQPAQHPHVLLSHPRLYLAMAPQHQDSSWAQYPQQQMQQQQQQMQQQQMQQHHHHQSQHVNIQAQQIRQSQHHLGAPVQNHHQQIQQHVQRHVQHVKPTSAPSTPKRSRAVPSVVKDSGSREPAAKRQRKKQAPTSVIKILQDVNNQTPRQPETGLHTKRDRKVASKGMAAKINLQQSRAGGLEKKQAGVTNSVGSVESSSASPSDSTTNIILNVCKFVSKRTDAGCTCRLVLSKHKRNHLCVMCKQGHQWVWCRDCCRCPQDNPNVRGCRNKSHWFERDSFDTGKRNHMNRHEK